MKKHLRGGERGGEHHMTDPKPVLVVGGTGRHLGGQVIDELTGRGKAVRAGSDPGSDAS